MRKFTKLFCTAFLLLGGYVSASAQDDAIDLTADMFYSWDGFGADASSTGQVTVDFNVGKELGAGALVAGTGTVDYLIYADLTGCTKMIFEGSTGVQLRVLMNRQESNNGPLVEKNPTIGDNGSAELDLTELPYVHLNAIKTGWGSPSGTITAIKLVKPADPLAIQKETLKNAISAAKMRTALGKTEESWSALQKAIEAAESALAATDATEETLTAAKTTVEDAMNGLVLAKGYTALTSDMFMNWENPENPVALNLATVLFQSTGQPYGDPSVKYFNYADISKYDKLIVGVIAGTPRIMLNRAEPLPEGSEGYDANGGAYVQITDAPVEGVVEVDLTQYEFAHLNAIKGANWQNVTVTDLLLYKESVITDIEIAPADGDIAAAIAAAKAEIENKGDEVGNIIINLTKGTIYTVSAAIEAPASVTIHGNGAIIDASALTTPFIQMATIAEGVALNEKDAYVIDGINIVDVAITGLPYQLIYANKQKYLMNKVLVENSVIGINGAAKKTIFDFNGGGNASEILIDNSTLWANPSNEQNGGLHSSQSGHGAIQDLGSEKQLFAIINSTIYNIAYGKTTVSQRRNNTAGMEFQVKNSVIVNSGKKGQFIVGLNGGSANSVQTYSINNNIFNFDGEDVSAAEEAKVQEKIADATFNSVAGVVTFTDAAAGDFNGTFEPAEGTEAPETICGDPRWTISVAEPVEPIIPDGEYYVINAAYEDPALLIAAGDKVDEKGVRLAFAFENGAYTITGNDFFADKKWTVEPDEWGFTFTISTVIDGVKKYVAIDNNWLKNLILTEELEDNAYWAFMYPEYWESLNAAGEVLYALTEGETFTSGQVVEVMDENKEAVATIQYGEAGEDYADFKAAKADGQVEGFTAFTEGNGTNGNKAGGTFYTIVPKYNGVISAGIVLNGGKAFHLTVDGVQNPVFDGNTLTNKYYGTFSFNVEAGKSYKFWCDGSKLGFYGFDYVWGPDVEPITEVGLNDETVGIATVKFDTTNGAIYNLNGQKMSGTLKSGLYIVNGKKVMVK